jgi:hypothetical protein
MGWGELGVNEMAQGCPPPRWQTTEEDMHTGRRACPLHPHAFTTDTLCNRRERRRGGRARAREGERGEKDVSGCFGHTVEQTAGRPRSQLPWVGSHSPHRPAWASCRVASLPACWRRESEQAEETGCSPLPHGQTEKACRAPGWGGVRGGG